MDKIMKQYFELAMVFIRKLFSLNLTPAQLTELIENKDHQFWVGFDEAAKLLVPVPVVSGEVTVANDTLRQLGFWTRFYKQELNLDLSEIQIPERQGGFGWLIVVPQGITLNQVWELCKKHFKCWKYSDQDLESLITENDRDPKNGSYAIWVRDVVEADQEMKNLSANDIKKKSIKGLIVLERALLELKYFSETGKHLDLENWTLCAGSRHAGGSVPGACWDSGYDGFGVSWAGADFRASFLRSRVVVG